MDKVKLNEKVKRFWEGHTCGTIGLTEEISVDAFSDEYFDHIERHRYRVEAWVHEYALFTQWHGKDVLEIGSGAGTDALQFCKAGARYTGIDLTEAGIKHTRERLERLGFAPQLKAMSAHELDFPENSFDLVFSWGVLHHSPYTEEIIEKMYRVLRPGGKFVVLLYNTHSWVVYKTLIKHGLLRMNLIKYGYTGMMSRHTEAADNMNPLTKTYTRTQCKELFKQFNAVNVSTRISRADRRNLPFISDFSFGGRIGWHNIVTGFKPE